MTQYYKTTWTKGMNTRPQPNVNNTSNGTIAFASPPVEVLEVLDVTTTSATAKAGDQWVRISSVPQWVAVKHMGTVYGVLTTVTDPPVSGFPESAEWKITDPKHRDFGKVARYVFEREL